MREIMTTLDRLKQSQPNAIAVRHVDESLTYEALALESDKLAQWISKCDKPIILYGHMSPYMIVGMIAAIKAGCGYVPIDTSIPEDRVRMIINKVKPDFIFDTSEGLPISTDADIITEKALQDAGNVDPFEGRMQLEDCVYTIFTSGSTGEPKGVQIQYDSLLEFTEWMLDLNQAGEQRNWLNQAPFSFDLSVMAIYPCLMSGGTLNLVDKEMIRKPKLLNDMLTSVEMHVWVSTPSFLEMCLLLPTLSGEHFPELKQFFFCGEIFAHRTAKALVSRFPEATIYNTYGPTEATVAVTSIAITPDVLEQYNPLPVGEARPGVTLSTLECGELVIEGKAVSLGYLENPEKTEAAFNFDGPERRYFTGDRGKQEGTQWFIQGRIDFQIKMNGYRMELEEIETQLRQTKLVRDAIVVPVEKNGKVVHLIGAIVSDETIEDAHAASNEIKEELKSCLPEYMIPRKFTWLEQLPMTPNGKLDRKAIAEVVLG